MKAKYSVSAEMLRLMGRKLYSAHTLPIMVREVLQNSHDAGGSISLTIERKPEGFLVTCADTGCGMDEDTLINKFLCLGGTTKAAQAGAVGAFGIAKAAIVSNSFWQISTQAQGHPRLYVDSIILDAEGEVEHQPPTAVGTTVTALVECPSYEAARHFNYAMSMLYGSDLDVDFSYIDETKSFYDPNAGFKPTPPFPMLSTPDYSMTQYPHYPRPYMSYDGNVTRPAR